MATTPKNYPYPAAADPNNYPADMQALAEKVDARPGISPLTTAQRDALAGADLWDGRVILNLDSKLLERYNATTTSWTPAGVSDHGGLGGLADDDHPHYLNLTRHDVTTRHGATVVDHGSIGGLADDDHPQYSLVGHAHELFQRKSADQTVTNSDVLQPDNHLTLSLAANAVYELRAVLFVNAGGLGSDFKLAFDIPNDAAIRWGTMGLAVPTGDATDSNVSTVVETLDGGARALGATNQDTVIEVRGLIATVSGGACTLLWAQNFATVTTLRMYADSYIVASKLA